MARPHLLADLTRRDRLLRDIAGGASDSAAARDAGINPKSVKRYAETNPEFAQLLINAKARRLIIPVLVPPTVSAASAVPVPPATGAGARVAQVAVVDTRAVDPFELTPEGVMGFLRSCAMDYQSVPALQAQARQMLWDFYCRPEITAQERRDEMLDMATPVTAKASTERGLTAGTVEQVMDAIAGKAIPSPE